MSALSKLITKVTKRQFAIATTPEQMSVLLDRTVSFAESSQRSGEPYLSDDEIDEIVAIIPVTEPETASGATEAEAPTETQETEEQASDDASEAQEGI